MIRLALMGAALAGSALAHGGATGIVKERMDDMVALGQAMKVLVTESRATAPDEKAMQAATDTLATHAGAAMLARFPEGSMQPASEARPEIWTDWARFSALAGQLETDAGTLKAAVGTNDFARALEATRATCTACHDAFRLKK